jgi:ABC-type spermidine/putrescine transport system permease subunit II
VHIERGFGVPVGDFLHGLLHFYRIELVHLVPNSITIATFIHLCEAYLGIAPHFHLWRHFFELKKMVKGVVVGSVSFMLR